MHLEQLGAIGKPIPMSSLGAPGPQITLPCESYAPPSLHHQHNLGRWACVESKPSLGSLHRKSFKAQKMTESCPYSYTNYQNPATSFNTICAHPYIWFIHMTLIVMRDWLWGSQCSSSLSWDDSGAASHDGSCLGAGPKLHCHNVCVIVHLRFCGSCCLYIASCSRIARPRTAWQHAESDSMSLPRCVRWNSDFELQICLCSGFLDHSNRVPPHIWTLHWRVAVLKLQCSAHSATWVSFLCEVSERFLGNPHELIFSIFRKIKPRRV